MVKINENLFGVIGLIILVSFLFRYILGDIMGVVAIIAIAFILFYFYSRIFESIARKDFSEFAKNTQTHVILLILLIFLVASTMSKVSDSRNAFLISAVFLSLYLVIKLVLIEYYLQREAKDELERESSIRKRVAERQKRRRKKVK